MVNPVCEVFLTDSHIAAPAESVPGETGAVVDFWGVVRGLEGNAEITGIEYEANRAMAEYQLRAIAEEAAITFELKQIIICHRIGFVATGEASLLVRVGAGHRVAAFRAIEEVVDELKRRAPIWKHPQFRVGSSGESGARSSSLVLADSPPA
ncbi:MAG: molybdenum cofactor biosynthesis protein MoaE [Verrucomicrobiota bacterium]|nr:molybdenum cofactor biosynthesis protein MoaE [Verrucomicrobiota bacterium]